MELKRNPLLREIDEAYDAFKKVSIEMEKEYEKFRDTLPKVSMFDSIRLSGKEWKRLELKRTEAYNSYLKVYRINMEKWEESNEISKVDS